MKKRAYKTTDVKKVNVERLQKKVEGAASAAKFSWLSW